MGLLFCHHSYSARSCKLTCPFIRGEQVSLLLVTASGRRKSGLGKTRPLPHLRAQSRGAGLGGQAFRLPGAASQTHRSGITLGRPWQGPEKASRDTSSGPSLLRRIGCHLLWGTTARFSREVFVDLTLCQAQAGRHPWKPATKICVVRTDGCTPHHHPRTFREGHPGR